MPNQTITHADYSNAIGILSMMRLDLPDGMWPAIVECLESIRDSYRLSIPIDWTYEAELINEICADWSFSSPFGPLTI